MLCFRGSAALKSFSFLSLFLFCLGLTLTRLDAQNFDWLRRFGTDRDDQANAVTQSS